MLPPSARKAKAARPSATAKPRTSAKVRYASLTEFDLSDDAALVGPKRPPRRSSPKALAGVFYYSREEGSVGGGYCQP